MLLAQDREATPSGLTRIPALDGLRGVAVVAVIAFHADLTWASGGFLGVDMFFVLSGFLITSLLRSEHTSNGAVSLRGFWSRRARRLLPALGFLCLGILAFGLVYSDHPSLSGLRGDMLSSLGYVANWHFIAQGGSYFGAFAPSPLQHLWSLAIEEQFYLLWPLAFLVVVRLRRPAVFVGAAAAVSAVLMAVTVDGANPSVAYYGTHTHAHGLLLGAALAFVTIRPSRWLSRAGVVAAWAMLLCVVWFDGTSVWVYRGGLFAFELLTVVVIAACLQPRPTVVTRTLAWRPLRAVGLVSYGLYLWHWPVFVLVDGQLVGITGSPLLALQVTITVALTLFSYFVIERPFRRGTLPGGHPLAFVPVIAGALVALLLFVSASLDSPMANAARLVEQQQDLSRANPGTLRVLLVGDSVAETLAPGIAAAARPLNIEIVSGTEAGCALDWKVAKLRGRDGRWVGIPTVGAGDCRWPRRWPQLLRRYRPDLVLINFGLWDTSDHRVGPKTYRYDTPAWRDHMNAVASDAVRVAGRDGAEVGFILSGSLFSGIGPLNDLLTEVAARDRSPVFDLRPIVDGRGTDYRWDGVHYSAFGSRAVGEQIAAWIAGLPHPPPAAEGSALE